MAEQPATPPIGWVPAWAGLQERQADPAGAGFVVGMGQGRRDEGQEYVAAWPGPGVDDLPAVVAGRPETRLTLVCADASAAQGAAPGGLAQVSRLVLLQAPTAELDTGVQLPDNSQVALAPMETFDAVEITVFDRPVARGRVRIQDDFAAVAIKELPEGPEKETFERALFAAMAEEAFLHGAPYLHMVVEPGAAATYEASGWAVAGHLVSLEKK